ncbi:hypothetical protein [Acidimangrovimonas pyrenivorans]|uniref:Uncharacterized protein n=1 Tax=Acidimangrovimonas pyrenivorans TaxID=2030798 RepID=A0ABV7AJP2_9RHOB
MSATATAILKRSFFMIPVLGWIARDIATKGEENFWYALVVFLTAVTLATMTYGPMALTMTALVAVPIMFVILIRITLG